MPFEMFLGSSGRSVPGPSVTLGKSGTLTVNDAALALVGTPEVCTMHYDRERQIIGLKPCEANTPYARMLKSKKSQCRIAVSLSSFLTYYGIETTETRRYEARELDGMLCFKLTEGQPAHA